MKCAWDKLLKILPVRYRESIDLLGKDNLQELRLRINSPPELVMQSGSSWLNEITTLADLNYVVNTASQYSPWSAATVSQGFLTAPGGHRIGICGEAVIRKRELQGFQRIDSICIRVARDHVGIADKLTDITGSVLIIGPPGWGKTTLLRDLIRQAGKNKKVCVVDERQELFPEGFEQGRRVDVLRGCSKVQGIEMLLRTMGPEFIAVDEITAKEDAMALLHAAHCGVSLLATAHALSVDDLERNEVYRALLAQGGFEHILLLNRDKTYQVERCTK